MTSLLDLPRELYLMLAAVSRDHYLAVQQPLYASVVLTRYASLIKLVSTLSRTPVVSAISKQQRLRWFKLTDEQLRDCDIKHLDLVLDRAKDGSRITGAVLSNCIGAIARKCCGVRICLTLVGGWPKFLSQLERFGLPNVVELVLRLQITDVQAETEGLHKIWDLVFSGLTFTDLQTVRFHRSVTSGRRSAHSASFHGAAETASTVYGAPDWRSTARDGPKCSTSQFYGLRKMKRITIGHILYLTPDIMDSLFGSEIIPHNLTRLEIANCTGLHPVKHLDSISTLLRRALRLVTHLQLHLCKLPDFDRDETFPNSQYADQIDEHPEDHFCNVIREMGHKVHHLDVALPFVCRNIFAIPTKVARSAVHCLGDYPTMPYEPHGTLVGRLLDEGDRYWRVICWHGVCRYGQNWSDVIEAASNDQAEMVSCELLNAAENRGSWHISGCSPLMFKVNDMLGRTTDSQP
ncbi:hypothetical protein BAUCODRAFT_21843 [Baudoinia panamericana UAMH 10762]|uniref:Uncharacterized protein n=1 Tax=Baudoinia panamericana (strain UAMH 10762) TaxID=717646 RepID=M2MTG8_BAUPA|nr:uncharacterized protein BAUCODRAFT_21843 [Baudoinia panamericana UAMH 10762]EMD00197.1 hypothetical protein BAUCODRAFT_21843 [Baudoinia panamericana UAMH 10762]